MALNPAENWHVLIEFQKYNIMVIPDFLQKETAICSSFSHHISYLSYLDLDVCVCCGSAKSLTEP